MCIWSSYHFFLSLSLSFLKFTITLLVEEPIIVNWNIQPLKGPDLDMYHDFITYQLCVLRQFGQPLQALVLSNEASNHIIYV